MACGTPVVASAAGALPETCGDAALLVDPEDREGLTDALLAAATDAALRARLAGAGTERAAQFGWDRTARLTDEAIDGLLRGSG
jgi:glycosyltransferase involved in cell wall biosynthesis